jgi:cupin superfamily acireductone dioxygenase involved in methionine salvage
MNFEKDYSLVSFLSTGTTVRSYWFMDNGTSCHMTEAWDIFRSLTEKYLYFHVDHGDDPMYVVKGEGIITFHLESVFSLDVEDVLCVPFLNNNFLSVSPMEDKGFVITF